LSALRTGRLYPPGNIPGTHFCYRLSKPQGHSAAGRIMSMKNTIKTIVNRTRDLPVCSAVPQPTAYTQVHTANSDSWTANCQCSQCFIRSRYPTNSPNSPYHFNTVKNAIIQSLEQCFSTAGTRPGTGQWHQLYRDARGSPGSCHFSF